MLSAPDMWLQFADRYLDVLDQAGRGAGPTPKHDWRPENSNRERRTADLAEWHGMLLERLLGSEAEDRLDTRRLQDRSWASLPPNWPISAATSALPGAS
jgi:hypothetical protein